ncbi:MAG: T9SS type A sorting domain-containing protein, partial [Chitinophagaceae bacterium]|nr:T9SS type A sorting domain-containing protein [Chitinophagaceae bacterium]
VTGANGCTATASITITQDVTVPTAGITNNTGNTVLTCTQTSISVTATGGASYSWSDGTTVVGTAANLTITAAGTYTVTVTGANGCTATASITITQDVTVPTITGTTPGSRCGSGTVVLGATASSGTINWYASPTGGSSLGTGTSFTTPSITATTSYWVDATGANGCVTASRTEVIATVNAIPAAPSIVVSEGSTTFCAPGTVILAADPNTGIQWYRNTVLLSGETSANIETSVAGNYSATYTLNGCESPQSSVITVTVHTGPPAVDPITGNTTVSISGTSQLSNATPNGVWSTNNSGIATVSTTGLIAGVAEGNTTINYAVTNTCGTTTVSVNVTVTGAGGRLLTVATIPGSGSLSRLRETSLSVTAMPNTTTDQFNLVIKSKENSAIAVRILDMYGTVVETHAKIAPGTTLKVGSGWSAGIYFAEVLQGQTKQVIRLVKMN